MAEQTAHTHMSATACPTREMAGKQTADLNGVGEGLDYLGGKKNNKAAILHLSLHAYCYRYVGLQWLIFRPDSVMWICIYR